MTFAVRHRVKVIDGWGILGFVYDMTFAVRHRVKVAHGWDEG